MPSVSNITNARVRGIFTVVKLMINEYTGASSEAVVPAGIIFKQNFVYIHLAVVLAAFCFFLDWEKTGGGEGHGSAPVYSPHGGKIRRVGCVNKKNYEVLSYVE